MPALIAIVCAAVLAVVFFCVPYERHYDKIRHPDDTGNFYYHIMPALLFDRTLPAPFLLLSSSNPLVFTFFDKYLYGTQYQKTILSLFHLYDNLFGE